MKALLLFHFILIFNLSHGQEHYYGFDLGGSIASVERVDYGYYKSITGFCFNGNHTFKKGLFIKKTSLGYQPKGFSQELIYVDENGAILGQGAVEKTKFRYMTLSGLAGVEFGNKIFGSFIGGIAASYYLHSIVSADQFTLDDGGLVNGYSYNYDNVERLDFTGVIQGSFGIQLNDDSDILLGLSYNRGIKKIRYREIPTVVPWYNHYVTFQIGFRKKIKK